MYRRQIRDINERLSLKGVAIHLKMGEHGAKKRFYIL